MRKRPRKNDSGDETRFQVSDKRSRSKSPELDVYLEIFPEPITLHDNMDDDDQLPETLDVKAEHQNQHRNDETIIAADDDTKITMKEEEQDINKPLEKSKDFISKKDDHGMKIKSKMIKEEEEDTSSLSGIQDNEVADVSELSIVTVSESSDDEASSSESENQQDSPQSPEPIIAEVKPNDLTHEVVSSSETDESEIDHRNAQSANRTVKRKPTDESSSRSSDESSMDSNSNMKDYSSCNARMFKGAGSHRNEKQSTKKHISRSGSEEDGMFGGKGDEISPTDQASEESKKTLNRVAAKAGKSDSGSGDESQSQHPSGDKNKENGTRKRSKSKKSMKNKITRMKRYLITAGIRVKYANLWSGCNSDVERVDRMTKLLKEKGLHGEPNLQKCKRLKLKNERIKDVAELDSRNIISQERVTRARRGEGSEINVPIVPSPTYHDSQILVKRLQLLCSSDTE